MENLELPESMNAMTYDQFGDPNVLKAQKIPIPKIKSDQILIKTHASSINMPDIVFRSGMKVGFGLIRLVTGVRKPKRKVLGFDIAGEIVSLGSEISDFTVGDRIFGSTISGANAEFAVCRSDAIALIPDDLGYQEVAGLPMSGLSALQGLRLSENHPNAKSILIYGASGGIGTYLLQICNTKGLEITGVASGRNETLVRDLGANHFIDYTKENWFRNQKHYDIVFDAVGKLPNNLWKKLLNENGIFINAGNPNMSMLRFMFSQLGNIFRNKKYRSFDTKYVKSDLEKLASYCTNGTIKTVIDKTFTLDEINEAHAYYESGRTRGKIIISLDRN